MARKICQKGLDLIKSFEGLYLESYICPGGVLTIGYGHTGPDVHKGQKITAATAEKWLHDDLHHFAQGVERLLPGMPEHTFCALVSFSFNCGLGALERSTLRKRILAGEDPYVVLPEELPKWVKANGRTLAGLVRRRKAEVLHAQLDGPRGQVEERQEIETVGPPVKLEPFFNWYEAEPHQIEAIHLLEEAINAADPDILQAHAPWVRAYRKQGNRLLQLPVPYHYQLDSDGPQGGRMCFSSTNAMLVEYLKPGLLRGEQADDAFLDVVERHGDTTSAEAQVSALLDCGIHASFRTDGTQQQALQLLGLGVPVPIGVLHKGHLNGGGPSGGGHWLLLVGVDLDTEEWVAHDPAGAMRIVEGGYGWDDSPVAGRFIRYPMEELNRRWMVAGDGDGWFIEVHR